MGNTKMRELYFPLKNFFLHDKWNKLFASILRCLELFDSTQNSELVYFFFNSIWVSFFVFDHKKLNMCMLQNSRNLKKAQNFCSHFAPDTIHNSLGSTVNRSEIDWKGKVLNCCTNFYVL